MKTPTESPKPDTMKKVIVTAPGALLQEPVAKWPPKLVIQDDARHPTFQGWKP